MAWYNSIKDFGKAVGGVVSTAAAIGSVIPGPWQPAAKAVTLLGGLLGGGGSSGSDQASSYIQQGADAQTAYQLAALDQYRQLTNTQLATTTADKQLAYDVAKGQYSANQQNILPYQMASLSSLQALPQLQQLLGLQAYNIPTTISQYRPPSVSYTDLYKNTAATMFPTDSTEGTTGTTTATADTTTTVPTTDTGIRVNVKATDETVNQLIANGQTGTPAELAVIAGNTGVSTTADLTPYTGPSYDLNNSPLFQWQKKIADEGLAAQLAASGLTGSTYAQREFSRQNQQLTANERERVVGNLSSLVNLGMSGSQLGQANFQVPTGSDVSSIYGQSAQDVASIYGNLGAIQGQLSSQLAQNAVAQQNAKASSGSGITDLLQLASSYGWLGGGSSSSSSGGLGGMLNWSGTSGGLGSLF